MCICDKFWANKVQTDNTLHEPFLDDDPSFHVSVVCIMLCIVYNKDHLPYNREWDFEHFLHFHYFYFCSVFSENKVLDKKLDCVS
jgi:hypothetical protein